MNPCDLSDYFLDHLVTKYEHWIMEHGELNEVIESFVKWCREEEVIAMNVKRSQDGKSYLERHEG